MGAPNWTRTETKTLVAAVPLDGPPPDPKTVTKLAKELNRPETGIMSKWYDLRRAKHLRKKVNHHAPAQGESGDKEPVTVATKAKAEPKVSVRVSMTCRNCGERNEFEVNTIM